MSPDPVWWAIQFRPGLAFRTPHSRLRLSNPRHGPDTFFCIPKTTARCILVTALEPTSLCYQSKILHTRNSFHVSLAYRCGPRVSRLGRRVAISSGTEGWVANRTHTLTIILRQILTTLTSATSKVPTGISDPLSSGDHFVSSPLPILLVDPLGRPEDGFMSLQNGCMTYAGVSQI
jgi:hypothetical protein